MELMVVLFKSLEVEIHVTLPILLGLRCRLMVYQFEDGGWWFVSSF
jgi:hypothetical protein